MKLLTKNPDTGKTIAWVALGVAAAYGAYILFFKKGKPGIPDNLSITKYQNTRTGVAVSSGFLDVVNGDIVKVFFEYSYFGPALSGTYHVSLWQKTALDPHDEVGPTDKSFDIPAYSESTKIESSVDMEIKAGEGEYGLYMKIMSIPGDDIFTPYYASRIRVGTGAVVGEWVQLGSTISISVKVITAITDWIQLGNTIPIAVKALVPISEWVLLTTPINIAVKAAVPITEWIQLGSTVSISVISLALGEFTLDVESDPWWRGTVSKDPSKDLYYYGEIVTLTANPFAGSIFSYWYLRETNEWLGYGNPINFMVLANHIVVAKFD